jgi:hypothetical protein
VVNGKCFDGRRVEEAILSVLLQQFIDLPPHFRVGSASLIEETRSLVAIEFAGRMIQSLDLVPPLIHRDFGASLNTR